MCLGDQILFNKDWLKEMCNCCCVVVWAPKGLQWLHVPRIYSNLDFEPLDGATIGSVFADIPPVAAESKAFHHR